MKVSNKMLRLALAGATVAMLSVNAMAQGYYDDDIYYDASKAKAKKSVQKVTETPRKAVTTKTVTTTTVVSPDGNTVVSVPASALSKVTTSTSTVTTRTSSRDVDEYNRRGSYKPVDNKSVDDLGDNFEYTRRIERFYNSDIVSGSDDDDLIYYYNNANDELADVNRTSPTTINIYVENPDPWDGFWNPYYYSSAWSWAWRPAYYNPWYSWNYAWGYGPSWSLSWGWGPSWDFGWNWGWNYPSYGWGWNPGWGWNHPGPGWGGPHHPNYPGHNWGWNPSRPAGPGASRPSARPGVVTRPSARPSQNGTLSSNHSARGDRRPSSARPSGTTNRPTGVASSSSSSVPRSSNVRGGYVPGRTEGSAVSTGRNSSNLTGRTGISGSSTSGRTSSGYRSSSSSSGRSSSSSSSSSSSYNRSSSSSSGRSSGFNSGSSSSGRSYGGGSGRSGGGGGGRSGRH